MRIGHGYDVHQLVEGRDLNTRRYYPLGLLGHSDADVLVHAIMDALLGATALGDIGKLFPESNSAYKNANSLELLKKICFILKQSNYKIENIDSTIVAQAPKLSEYILEIRKNIASACEVSYNKISVKATTEESLGFTGELKGIAAHSVCLIKNF